MNNKTVWHIKEKQKERMGQTKRNGLEWIHDAAS